MNAKLLSFYDIFHSAEAEGECAFQLKRIVVPIIQRDYAQGRKVAEIEKIRSRFLDALHSAVTVKSIVLDFVYGSLDEDGTLIPLDGQQRLTTLFLLHWYAAKKAGIPDDEYVFLKGFSYETRYSARDFSRELVDFTPEFTDAISVEISNQDWFPLSWKKDATISSMLVVLDAIQEKFASVDDLWQKLREGAIKFYFLPINDMGLTDEIYIKMNSRGKPLTLFEHFKAELERELRLTDVATAKRIISKIDREWTDLLWQYRDSGNGLPEDSVIDEEFLRYFRFICDVICYEQGESLAGREDDEFDLIQRYFSHKLERVAANIKLLECYFDCWCKIAGYKNPQDFLTAYMSTRHASGKILVEKRYDLDIFGDCLRCYGERTGNNNRIFPLGRFVLLYAVNIFLCQSGIRDKLPEIADVPEVSEDDFVRRLRIINNLIQNSEFQISDRTSGNRMPAILRAVREIMLTGVIKVDNKDNFNEYQLLEEKNKIEYLQKHPEDTEKVFALEDHPLLRGQVGIVWDNDFRYGDKFARLFLYETDKPACNFDAIDCALMAIGDYGQNENSWRYQYGSASAAHQKAWENLFHKSRNGGFSRTKAVLLALLSKLECYETEALRSVSDEFVAKCEAEHSYPWRYYYIKYREFRPGSFGKIVREVADDCSYSTYILTTQRYISINTYIPYFAAAKNMLSASGTDVACSYTELPLNLKARLEMGNMQISWDGGASYQFTFKNPSGEWQTKLFSITRQNGIDRENRVEKLASWLTKLLKEN